MASLAVGGLFGDCCCRWRRCGFIYIAGSDLVPELNKESKLGKAVVQLVAIGLGVGLMLLLDVLEESACMRKEDRSMLWRK